MARHMRNGRDYSRPGPKVDYELRKNSNNAARSGEVYDKIEEIQSQIVPTASIEMGETASRAYNVGEYLVKNGSLWKVTNAIAEGDALTVGTNIDSTTVVGEIKSNLTDKWTFNKLTATDNNVTVPSGVKEFYLCGVDVRVRNASFNAITIPIELFNYGENLKFYSYVNDDGSVYIMRTSTENVYLVHHNPGYAFAILGYR